MADVAVVVYGASGFTGRMICAELSRRKIEFAIAGRDREKLRALAATLSPSPEVLVAPLDDEGALVAAIERGRVVLACAGPFARLGAPVRQAAILAKRHYLDITGETPYILATVEHDAAARAAGSALVNSVGFDVVPTDAAAVLATEALGARPDTVDIAIKFGGRASQGTTRSALEHAASGSAAFVEGRYVTEPVGHKRWEVPMPGPLGVQTAISIPWGDLATAPRSTGARNVRTYAVVSPGVAMAMPLFGLASKALGFSPIKQLAERFVQRLPEGPTDAERARAHCAAVARASVDGRHATAWVTTGDAYDFTAVAAVECAVRAADAAFDKKGALTPTQAFGAREILEALAGHGVRFGVD